MNQLQRTTSKIFLAAGLLQIIGSLLHGDNADPAALLSPLWPITQTILFFFYALLAWGLWRLRQTHRQQLARWGQWGIWLILISIIPLLMVSLAYAFLLPGIAAQQQPPKALMALLDPATGLGWLLALTMTYLVLFVPGTILLGSTIWRSTTLPKQAGLLLVVGILISFLGAGIPGFAIGRAVGGVLYGRNHSLPLEMNVKTSSALLGVCKTNATLVR
jgi:hypothetical protein